MTQESIKIEIPKEVIENSIMNLLKIKASGTAVVTSPPKK